MNTESTGNSVPLEIERKWLVNGWPQGLSLIKEEIMRQGYVSVSPTVRIRSGQDDEGKEEYILCFKSSGGLSRMELEFPISEEHFRQLEIIIGHPLIDKVRRVYALPDGRRLEVNHVDEGMPTEFWYAEIEFESESAANAYIPGEWGLGEYLDDDVTDQPGQTMGAYWNVTRLNGTGS